MNEHTGNISAIACGVLRHELDSLRARGDIDFPVRCLDSMLHIHPHRLHNRLDRLIEDRRRKGCEVLLIYGDCHAYMHDQEAESGVYRVRGRNCAEILLGPELYKTLWRENAFIFLPEWTMRWNEIFDKELGLRGKTNQEFMREMSSKLTYVDTGVMPVPVDHLNAASDAMDLPWEVVDVGTDHLLETVREAVERIVAPVG